MASTCKRNSRAEIKKPIDSPNGFEPVTHDEQHVWIGRAFFIWVSVFNLFVISVFWSFVVDVFNAEQAKRLFGCILQGAITCAMRWLLQLVPMRQACQWLLSPWA